MSAGIFVVHTPDQARDAGALIDLLESALALPDGALACSSLPGYAWAASGQGNVAEWDAMLARVGAAIAIADSDALSSPQWMFDIASAHGRGLWTVVLLDDATQAARLPVQLTSATLALRSDATSVRSVVEDLAFELGVAPRLGKETKEAISTFSSFPPASSTVGREQAGREQASSASRQLPPITGDSSPHNVITQRPPAHAKGEYDAFDYDALDTVPPPAMSSMPSEPPPFASSEDPFELDEDELQPIDGGMVLVSRVHGATPSMALDAGRAISECSFHRHSGGDFARELDQPFGRFIDSIGGDWSALQHIGDVEVWLGATDNLLDSLPPSNGAIAEWYELGYQLSTLLSIAEHGGLDDPRQRDSYIELWSQAVQQLGQSAERLRVPLEIFEHVLSQLENLIGPQHIRDYRNVAAALQAVRELALSADGRRSHAYPRAS